jgi:dTMP kinase
VKVRGKYVLFEGPDGSGKSTLARMLSEMLERAEQSVRRMAFPSRESAVGNLIRDTFEGKAAVSPSAMMWLFVAEGKDMEREISRTIGENRWLICDRHTMVSGLVYQAEVHGLDRVNAVTTPANFTVPDRIYLVDVPAKVAMERREARGEARNVLYEPDKLDRLEKMCQAYRDLRSRFVTSTIIDGTKPFDVNLRWMWQDLGLSGEPPLS